VIDTDDRVHRVGPDGDGEYDLWGLDRV